MYISEKEHIGVGIAVADQKPDLSGICKQCHQLNRTHHKILREMIDELSEMDENESQILSELLEKQGFGSISLMFRAGSCVGLDWQASHRTHET